MAGKRYTRWPRMNYLTAGMDMQRAGLHMTELFLSSMQVIQHRSEMIAYGINTMSLPYEEIMLMWQEKIIAGSEFLNVLAQHANSSASPAAIAIKAIAPFRRKTKSNVRRLNSKKRRPR